MKNSYIAVFDSGVGGLNILETLAEEFKNENFIYLADEEFFPYGVKTKEELENRMTLITRKLDSMNVKAIIIACNTASANSHHCNKLINTKIIEIITATANYAKLISHNNKIGVWATDATITSNKYHEALNDIEMCYPVKASDLVVLIEKNLINDTKSLVKNHLDEIKDADTLILGCTHFPLVSDVIKEFNNDLNLVSSNKPVSIALKEYLDENGLNNTINGKQIINLYTSKIDGELKEKAKRFNINVNKVEYLEIK